jgi:integrase/recombinase XerD
MSALEQSLADYLAMRRALGYKLQRAGKLLAQLVAWLDERGAPTITGDLALEWATLPPGSESNWHAQRLSVVRGFAGYLRSIDPACEPPPADLLPSRPRRSTPYLYRDSEIAALMAAAGVLGSPHRTATARALIGLLAVTGMRVGEAIRLDRGDIDHAHELLIVRDSKFGKSRQLPLHPTTIVALRRYLRRRDRPEQAARTSAVLVSAAGTRLLYCNVHHMFRRLARLAGLEARPGSCRPRLHDLRHTFAVQSLLDAYRDDGDAQGRLALLSTYLGHVDPGSTYWYLRAAPAPRPRQPAPRAPPRRR